MAYKTLGGGLDLSLSMESKSNSLPLMMSAGGRFGGIFKGFWGSIFEHPEVKDGKKTANIAIWREKTCIFCGGKTLRCYFRIYGVISCEAVIYQKVTLRFACFSPC